jgi:nanoRNase/pAp phosphatase (c-di-AMP/oligoRNAs hydrolase)
LGNNNQKIPTQKKECLDGCAELKQVIQRGKRLLIFLHDNPDPDAIAAGWLLAHIGAWCGVRTRMVYGGRLSRAENRNMVKLLKIPLHQLNRKAEVIRTTDILAIVDSQPGTGNNSFPAEQFTPHIIIDHHPLRPHVKADFLAISTHIGTCTTLVLKYFRDCGISLDSRLATAVAYAVVSETQDLFRESTPEDRDAMMSIFPYVNLRILARIRHPRRERGYYRTIARAMRQVRISKNICICHVGPVYIPEVVAEIADFLKAMEGITWCLVTGYHEQNRAMFLSVRSTGIKASAERIIQRVLKGLGRGGGHGQTAGGLSPCRDLTEYQEKISAITDRFLRALKAKEALQALLPEGQ